MANKFAHWADETADKIIREKGEKELYTCASGITPSGTVHIGNFREIISVELVVRALRARGKNVRFIYSWDDYDVFRKVPLNMPKAGELEKYLRFPITMVPDPWERDASYARHHEVDVESALPAVGIAPEYLYQTERYRAGLYADGMKKALENRGRLKEILDKFRDEDHKIQGEWWPVSVFCSACNRDETEITGWDGAWGLSYRCEHCGKAETVDLRTESAKGVKLGWRVDWPMRWAHERVDFEPAGKDHHSQGGSFDTGRLVSKEVYGNDAPVTFRYDFIGIKGADGKMSSSKGRVVDLPTLLRVYTPEVARYIFAGTRPNTEFTISFDLDVLKIYEDYDKTERVAWGIEKAKNEEVYGRERRIYELSQIQGGGSLPPASSHAASGASSGTPLSGGDAPPQRPPAGSPYQLPFRHLCNLLQINDMDIEKTLAGLEGVTPEQLPRLRKRAECAVNWVNDYAPEEFCFRLRNRESGVGNRESGVGSREPGSGSRGAGAGEREPGALDENDVRALRALRDEVISRIETFPDEKTTAQAIYDTATALGIDPKALFRAAYQALIGKDQGPRLASFLRTISKERLLGILSAY